MKNTGTGPTPEQRKILDSLVEAGYIGGWKPGEDEYSHYADLDDIEGEGGSAYIEYNALAAFLIAYDAGYARWGRRALSRL